MSFRAAKPRGIFRAVKEIPRYALNDINNSRNVIRLWQRVGVPDSSGARAQDGVTVGDVYCHQRAPDSLQTSIERNVPIVERHFCRDVSRVGGDG